MRTSDLPRVSELGVSEITIDDPTFEMLMAAYAAGDPAAWEPLFEQLAPRLLAFFRRSLPEAASAEDHVHATFIQLHRARRDYRPGTPLRPWVFAIATRVRVDDRTELGTAKQTTRVRGSGENPRDRQVREAIENLAPIERSVIHLQRFERMRFHEIAHVLGLSEATVRQWTLRAYRRLNERLWMLSDGGDRT